MIQEIPSSSSWRDYSRYQWTVLILFGTVNMFSAMTYSLQAPFYPAEAETKNVTASEYGIVFGSYEITAFVFCPVLGSFMYAIGPKTGFNVGVFVAGSSVICFGFLDKIDKAYFFAISLLLRIIQGTGTSAIFVSIYSYVTLEFPNSVATTFALMEMAFGFGFCIGPAVGQALYQAGGFILPFAVLGSILALSPIVSLFLLVRPGDPLRPEGNLNNNESRYGGIFHLLKISTILGNIFGTFTGGFTVGFIATTLEHHIRQFNLSPTLTALTFLSYGGVYALTGTIIGSICDRVKEPGFVTMTGAALMFASFLAIGPAPFIPIKPIVWLTWGGLLFLGLGVGCIYVSTFLLTMHDARRNNYPDSVATYGLVSGLWMSALSLGAFFGPVTGGLLQDNFGFRNATYVMFALTAALLLISSVCIFKRRSWTEQNPNTTSDERSLLNSTEVIWNDENVCESIP